MINQKKLTPKQKAVIALFKSGNFSVHCHDFCQYSVYTNRFEYKEFTDEEGNELNPGKEIYDTRDASGYLPEIVELLVMALGGKSGTA